MLQATVDVSKTVPTCPGPTNVLVIVAIIKLQIQRDAKVCSNDDISSRMCSVISFHLVFEITFDKR